MSSKILYICTGHQDQDHKVDYLIQLLKKVKSEGGDVCYGTHCNYRLNDISEYCNIIFDNNNEYLTEEFFYENCDYITEDTFSDCFTYTFKPNDKIILKKLYSTSHSKPCFLNIKNVIHFAKANNYEWIVYFEYDSLLPDGNLHEKIKKRIRVLENSNKVGYGYIAEDMRIGLIFPHLFISKVDIFYEYEKFNQPSKTNLEFLKTYGNILPEEILFRIFTNNENFILNSAFNLESDYDYHSDLTHSLSGIEPFSIYTAMESIINKTDLSIFKRECMLEFYPTKVSENIYTLYFWFINRSDVNYIFDYVEVSIDNNVVLFLENIHKGLSWWFEHIITNYQMNSESNNIVKLKYQVNLPNGEKHKEETKLHLKSLDKYHLYKNVEFLD